MQRIAEEDAAAIAAFAAIVANRQQVFEGWVVSRLRAYPRSLEMELERQREMIRCRKGPVDCGIAPRQRPSCQHPIDCRGLTMPVFQHGSATSERCEGIIHSRTDCERNRGPAREVEIEVACQQHW